MNNREATQPNYFSTYFIDRVSDKRRDDEWLTAQLENEATRFIPVWNLKNLLDDEGVPRPVYLSASDVQDLLPEAESTVLLGATPERTYFAIGLSSDEDSPPSGLAKLGEFRDLRWIAATLDERDIALLAYAQAMTYWHCRHQYCGVSNSNCAASLPSNNPSILTL